MHRTGAARLARLSVQLRQPVLVRHRRFSSAVASWEPQEFTGGGGYTTSGLRRVGFTLQFDTANLPQYLTDHEAVWPEMQQALVESGWHNYSLFYRPDGFAFGYFETETSGFEEACSKMDATKVNERWQEAMSKYTPANTSPIDAAGTLDHFFYLGSDRVMTKPAQLNKPNFVEGQSYTGGGGTTRSGLKRCCFQMKFNTEELAQYLRDHEAVWPEMQQALEDCDWHRCYYTGAEPVDPYTV